MLPEGPCIDKIYVGEARLNNSRMDSNLKLRYARVDSTMLFFRIFEAEKFHL